METLKQPLSPFKADIVGSFLRSERIKSIREKFQNEKVSQEELKQVEDEEILKLVEKQKQVGLQGITDGEFRRSWWHYDFMENLLGAEGRPGPKYQFQGIETRGYIVEITDKIAYNPNHPFFDHFRFLHSAVGENHVAKQTIPSPNMFLQENIRNTPVYDSLEELGKDLSEAYRLTIRKFYDLGCRYLQLDDVFWAHLVSSESREKEIANGVDPDYLASLCTKILNDALEDKPEDLLVTMHICRGNFHSSWVYSGGYDKISDYLFQVNVDGFFLEFDDERSGDFKPLKKVKGQKVVLGLMTSKTAELEDKERLKSRIKEASKYVPLEQICLSPQCGFASTEEGNVLTEDQQWKKIEHLQTLSREVWE